MVVRQGGGNVNRRNEGRMAEPPRVSTLIDRLQANPGFFELAASTPLPDGRYLGIVGLRLLERDWDLGGAIQIQAIGSRPDAHEISRALLDQQNAAAIGRYCHLVTHELAVGPEIATGADAIQLGLQFISLLRTKTLSEILIPAALSNSWSATVLNRIPQHTCDAIVLEDFPKFLSLEDPKIVNKDDLNWVIDNLSAFQQLHATMPAYALAVDSLCQHSHQGSVRMAAAMLWSGIEALFGLQSEINFRLALYVAGFLEDIGPARLSMFSAVKTEYNTRSKIVHGDMNDDAFICAHIVKTRHFLSRLLCKVTENRGMPSKEDLNSLILAGINPCVIVEDTQLTDEVHE